MLICLGLGAANLFLGDLNQDEGWYLYAARLVAHGQVPYADFATTQGPVLPYVYALADPLVCMWGVAGGRLFTFLLGLLCSIAAAALAARLAPAGTRAGAALVAFALIGVNVYQSYFFTIVKTYALAGLLLTLGFLCLVSACRKRSLVQGLLSGLFLMFAAGTRLSAGAVLPVVFLGLFVSWRREGRGMGSVLGGFCLGAMLGGIVQFVPFLVKAPQGLWFALVEYHAGRETGGLVKQLAYKAGFVSRVVYAYLPAVCMGVAAWFYGRACGAVAAGGPDRSVTVWLWSAVGAVTLLHFLAPFPYDDYQAMVFPLFAAAVAVALARRVVGPQAEARGPGSPDGQAAPGGWPAWLLGTVVLVCVLSAFSSPLNQAWVVGRRDRIWWPLKKQTPLAALRETAAFVRSIAKPGDVLLTQDPYLAVEAGLAVPVGMELGPFCYFPEWSEQKARACRVLNREMLLHVLETCPSPVAAFSGYGLAIRSPGVSELTKAEQSELWQALLSRYRTVRVVEDFGQAATTLKLLVPSEARAGVTER